MGPRGVYCEYLRKVDCEISRVYRVLYITPTYRMTPIHIKMIENKNKYSVRKVSFNARSIFDLALMFGGMSDAGPKTVSTSKTNSDTFNQRNSMIKVGVDARTGLFLDTI